MTCAVMRPEQGMQHQGYSVTFILTAPLDLRFHSMPSHLVPMDRQEVFVVWSKSQQKSMILLHGIPSPLLIPHALTARHSIR